MKTLAKLLLAIGAGLAGVCVLGCPPAETPTPGIPGDSGDGTSTPSASYTISGSVRDASGAGITGVTIQSDDGSSTTTDSEGNWSLADLQGTRTITPFREGWRFEPTNVEVSETSGPGSDIVFVETSLPFYPETESFPTLVFLWDESGVFGALNLTADTSGDIYGCSGFGTYEDGTINLELKIMFAYRQREPIYSLCAGTVTYVADWANFTTASNPDSGGEVWIRHGHNFAIVYRHVVTSGLDLQVGETVEKGDTVGYTADRDDSGSLYQFGLAQRQDSGYAWLNPYPYFNSSSRTRLVQIWNAAQRTDLDGYAGVTQPWGDLSVFVLSSGQEIAQRGGLE